MDIEEAIIREQYARMYANDDLLAAINMGSSPRPEDEEWLFDTWPYQKDVIFPYIIQNVELNPDEEFWAIHDGLYTLDIFDNNPKTDRIHAIKNQLIVMHQRLVYDTSGNNALKVRFWYRRSRSLEEDEPNIHHKRLEFDIRLYAQAEVLGVLNRS